MSNAIYPVGLAGETFPIVKRPVFSTVVQPTASGMEVRIANYPYALEEWDIPYSVLDMSTGDFATLYGFYCARFGAFDSFLFYDPNDNFVTGQSIGTGNGALRTFPMKRSVGSSTQYVYDINTVIASYPSSGAVAPKVYVGGVIATGWTISTVGVLTFNSAPTGAVTADFGYFWRCRFVEDKLEFSQFVTSMWEAQKVTLKRVRA
jgi:uncharacterized protein (TIGR02217 family)